MSNDLSTLIATVVARGLSSLREQTAMPRLVNFDYSAEAARPGDTIDVPIPAAIAAENVTPGPVPPSPPDLVPGKVQIALSNWKKAAFHLTDKEAAEITGRDGFVPMQMQEAVRALANAVNDSLHQEYRRIYTLIGTPGTTPFGSGVGILSATEARRKLNEMKAPRDGRRGVLDYDAEANALGLPQFSDAEKVGTAETKVEGEIGRKFGIDWYADDGVLTHVAGTAANAASYTITSAGAAAAVTRRMVWGRCDGRDNP